jgi:hypothetical protein
MIVTEVLDDYYKLKTKYETAYNKDKSKIKNQTDSSWKEKSNEYKSLKQKCINCGQLGGSIFSTIVNKDKGGGRNLIALCGNKLTPCPLNIDINVGRYKLLTDSVKEYEVEINIYKNKIIKSKNNLLFGYTTTEKVLNDFNEDKDLLSFFTTLQAFDIDEYTQKQSYKYNNDNIKELQEEIYIIINKIKSMITDYTDTQIVKDAVDIYVNELTPKLNKIMSMKYNNPYVEYDNDTNTYHLIQQKNTISDLEIEEVEMKVINYTVGTKINKKKNSETDSEIDSKTDDITINKVPLFVLPVKVNDRK